MVAWLSLGVATAAVVRAALPEELRAFFAPPAELAGQLGTYASPLKFFDGRPVASPADWPARRQEILRYWHTELGPWPELLQRPRLELAEKQDRDGVTQYRVEVEIVSGVTQHGYLLLPPARFAGRRPAVLVPFYAPEVSVDYTGPRPLAGQAKRFFKDGRPVHRDFALQLARRGFVTLAIGTPGDDAYKPVLHGVRCQPLSYYAYIAANCHTALAQRPEVDGSRIGVMGHSYGGKWAMFASCLYDKFAAAVWSDGGVVFDEKRGAVNYWEPWYLGLDPAVTRKPGLVTAANGRTGPYRRIFESGHDLHELHALMAPRPFLVSGGSEDGPARWVALNHAVAVNRFLGYEQRVAMTNRPAHSPTAESNEQAFRFLEHFLRP
ncbi:MAG: prolyl oligopeptidase family serine peptidase [Verrucomicrobia bacterium]|nr:prolyl oligopeptidase family serine peptidase [Verrucomicrobiota bacterium]